jgi:hypothetical protein
MHINRAYYKARHNQLTRHLESMAVNVTYSCVSLDAVQPVHKSRLYHMASHVSATIDRSIDRLCVCVRVCVCVCVLVGSLLPYLAREQCFG